MAQRKLPESGSLFQWPLIQSVCRRDRAAYYAFGRPDRRDVIRSVHSSLLNRRMTKTSPSLSRFSRFGRHSRSFQVTGTFLRRQLWFWPLLGAVVLSAVAWWVNSAVEAVMRKQVASELTAIRDADVTALRVWMKQQ